MKDVETKTTDPNIFKMLNPDPDAVLDPDTVLDGDPNTDRDTNPLCDHPNWSAES